MAVSAAFVVIAIFIFLTKALMGASNSVLSAQTFNRTVANGIPARGILLQVSQIATTLPGSQRPIPSLRGTPQVLRRFESRFVTIDVEIPGQAPYEVQLATMIPSNMSRDILPGATVELRLDPKRPNIIAIVGPGSAFAVAQLNAAPPDQRMS